jgi:hypothetical protein
MDEGKMYRDKWQTAVHTEKQLKLCVYNAFGISCFCTCRMVQKSGHTWLKMAYEYIFPCCFAFNLITFHACPFFLKVGVGLVPKRVCLLTLAYYAFPGRYEFGERQWNDILTGENRRTQRKTCPSATLSTTNHTWIDPGSNPSLRGERPATNDLSHDTAMRPLTNNFKSSYIKSSLF